MADGTVWYRDFYDKKKNLDARIYKVNSEDKNCFHIMYNYCTGDIACRVDFYGDGCKLRVGIGSGLVLRYNYIYNNKRNISEGITLVNCSKDKFLSDLKDSFDIPEKISTVLVNELHTFLDGAVRCYKRKLVSGDTIVSMGVSVVIREVLSQDLYNDEYDDSRSYVDIEFLDSKGMYRHWKSSLDGGYVRYFDDGNVYNELSDGTKKKLEKAKLCLENAGIDLNDSFVYFREMLLRGRDCSSKGVYALYNGKEDLGYLDLGNIRSDEVIFADIIRGITLDTSAERLFIGFPSNKLGNKWYIFTEKRRYEFLDVIV